MIDVRKGISTSIYHRFEIFHSNSDPPKASFQRASTDALQTTKPREGVDHSREGVDHTMKQT